jgi:hypothetical protein
VALACHPNVPALRIWALALVLSAVGFAFLEALASASGYSSDVTDSLELWHYWRQQVYKQDGKVIAFLGSSRVMADMSLTTVRECLPGYDVVQLGVSGSKSPIGVLRDLALDPRFKGTIICELDTPLLDHARWSDLDDFIGYYPASRCVYYEKLARARVADKVACLRHSLRARIGRWLVPPQNRDRCFRMTFEREGQWDFLACGDVDGLRRNTDSYRRQYATCKFPRVVSMLKDVGAIDDTIRGLCSRGGHVIFMRAPSSMERWTLEEQYFPRTKNWDRFARAIRAPCIHFMDVPELRVLRCPDESHLDRRDSREFTRIFIQELTSRRVLEGS